MKKRKRALILIVLVIIFLILFGFFLKDIWGKKSEETTEDGENVISEVDNEEKEESLKAEPDDSLTAAQKESDELLDKAIAGTILVTGWYEDGQEYTFYVTDLSFDEEEWDSYKIGERVDLDNDGITELIINGPYGGMYLDARDGAVYELACGEGTTGTLTYCTYDGKTWICHLDTSHEGREIYLMDEYNGNGEIVNSTSLKAEYWELGYYDETAECSFGDRSISSEEYEKLKQEIFGL